MCDPYNTAASAAADDDDDDDDVTVTMVTGSCDCSLAGSVTVTSSTNETVTPCDWLTGQCYCLKPGITGHRCDSCLPASGRKSYMYNTRNF